MVEVEGEEEGAEGAEEVRVDVYGFVVEVGEGVEGEGEAGYDEDDKNVYCTCRSLSHGNMVACDNEACRYEWFHWECVGLTREPVGRWLCPECKKLPASMVRVAK